MKARYLLLPLLLGLLGISSTQVITRGYIYTNIGTLFSWKSGAQSSWNGSTQNATCSDFYTYVGNDGTVCSNGQTDLTYGYATTHANNSGNHTPILANNTFAGGSFTSWGSSNTSACNGVLFLGSSGTDEDGDGGYAQATSGSCNATPAQVTLTQSFSTSGAPTSQTYSYWYKGKIAQTGDSTCTMGTGSVSLALKINSTTVNTTSSPTLDGEWHQVTGTMSAMVSGANTFTLTATLTAAVGQRSRIIAGEQTCVSALTAPQGIQIDNPVLTGTW